MKKTTFVAGVVCFVLIISICGCTTKQSGNVGGTAKFFSVNNPPIFSEVTPVNYSSNISIDTPSLSLSIKNPDGNLFNWSIETSPNVGHNSGKNDYNGTKSCILSSLNPSTTYYWFVNATDGRNWTREHYSFTTESAIVMTAKEFRDDYLYDFNETHYIESYKSLNDGNRLIIQDTINSIEKQSYQDYTTVEFKWESENGGEVINGKTYMYLYENFKGDITSLYKAGNEVKISVTIKHVVFSYNGKNYDMEVFKEEWDQDYFISHGADTLEGLKPLPQSCISKV